MANTKITDMTAASDSELAADLTQAFVEASVNVGGSFTDRKVPVAQFARLVSPSFYGYTIGELGDSITIAQDNELSQAATALRQRFVLPLNLGKGGITAQQIINVANDSTYYYTGSNLQITAMNGITYASRLAAAVAGCANGVRIWKVRCGVNDTTASRTFAQITADLTTIYTTLLNAGALILAYPMTPCADATHGVAAVQTEMMAIDNWINRYAASTPGMIFINDYPALVNPSTGAIATTTPSSSSDGLHPTAYGYYLMSPYTQAILSSLIPARDILPASNTDHYTTTVNVGDQILLNPLTTGSATATAGQATGNMASPNWVAQGNGNAVFAKVARTDGGPGEWQSITASSDGVIASLYQSSGTLVVGARYRAYCEYMIPSGSAITATTNVGTIGLRLNGGTGTYFIGGVPSTTSNSNRYQNQPVPLSGVLCMDYVPSVTTAVNVLFDWAAPSGTSGAIAYCSRITFRRIL